MSGLTYIECCEKYKQQIIDRFEPAQKVDKFFTKEEIDELRVYQFKNAKKVKFRETSSNIQPNVSINKMFVDMPWLQEKFSNFFEHNFSKKHSGNYYITTQPHDHHVDLPSEDEEGFDNLIPYKSVIIPLFLTHHTAASTAFFKQRRVGYSITFDRDRKTRQRDSLYKIARTYDGLIDINGNDCDPEKDYNNWSVEHYPHITKNNLRGFEEEIVLDYRVGSVMVFDACQVHASTMQLVTQRYNDGNCWMKNGINIQFYLDHASN